MAFSQEAIEFAMMLHKKHFINDKVVEWENEDPELQEAWISFASKLIKINRNRKKELTNEQ